MDDDMDDVPGAAAPPAAADAPPAADAPHLYWAVAPPERYKVREVYWSRAVARFGWFQQQLAEACQWEHVDIGMADELERAMGGCQALVVRRCLAARLRARGRAAEELDGFCLALPPPRSQVQAGHAAARVE